MNFNRILIVCITTVIVTGCDVASKEKSSPGNEAAISSPHEHAVRDPRLLGNWYPASGASNYTVTVSNKMLMIYDEVSTEYVEIEVTRNEQSSAAEPRIEGIKRFGRYQHQRTNDEDVLVRFAYEVNDDHLRLIRTWPTDANESVCPRHIEVVRGQSSAFVQPPTSSISAR
jgi:hypothetical protein